MLNTETRKQARADALEEARMDEEAEARTAIKLKLFLIASIVSGSLLFLTVVAIVPFLAGHSLHEHWESIGQYLVMLAMGLLPVFMLTAALAFGLWRYLRAMKDTDKKYAPPLSKHRTGAPSKLDWIVNCWMTGYPEPEVKILPTSVLATTRPQT